MFSRAVLVTAFLAVANAHSFLTVPMPISRVETCRVGGNGGFEAECPGPCPHYNFREDMRPENPAATYHRGERAQIHWSKNNHRDGFMRLSLVPLDEMLNKEAHSRYAFYFGCWTDQEYTCNQYEYHRDCYYDRQNLAYKTQVTIPTIYPDGVYVLGWTWYGGGEGFGSFGDYYDCSYIEIKGGPKDETFPAAFESVNGNCLASVDRLGVCATEPCNGEHWSKPRVPNEFSHGVPRLEKWWFDGAIERQGNQVEVARPDDFGIKGFSIMDTKHEHHLHVNQDWVIELHDNPVTITLVPEVFGRITAVEWFVNGEKAGSSFHHPWSIAGQQRHHGGWNYYDWHYHVLNRRVFVTALAWNGDRRAYFSKDLVFMPKR